LPFYISKSILYPRNRVQIHRLLHNLSLLSEQRNSIFAAGITNDFHEKKIINIGSRYCKIFKKA